MREGLCFAGSMIVDQLKFVQRYPNPGTLTTIMDIQHSLGGLVCNCAIDIAKLDPLVPVTALGIVGDDNAGDFILSEFAKHPSIDASGVRREGSTSFTDVVTEPGGRRTFYHFRGANARLDSAAFRFDSINARILHIGYILLLDALDGPDPVYPTALCRVLDEAHRNGLKTSVDIVSEESNRYPLLVPPALRYTDYCFLNEIEAERTTGITLRKEDALLMNNFAPSLYQLAEMGVSRWVVIHTPEISCGLDVKAGSLWFQPSLKLPEGFVISSVGAGDAFAAGMLLGANYGWSLPNAMQAAASIAAYSLKGRGASGAIRPLPVVLEAMKPYERKGYTP